MSHPPKDGQTYDTHCTADGPIATCEGDGLVADADNNNGFFTKGHRYVWYVRTAADNAPVGDEGTGAQSGS